MEINMDVNTNYDRWDDFEENTRRSLGSSHHHAILSHTGVNTKLENTVSLNSQLSGVDIKTHQIFINSIGNENIILIGDRVTGSFEIGGDFTWGGAKEQRDPPTSMLMLKMIVETPMIFMLNKIQTDLVTQADL